MKLTIIIPYYNVLDHIKRLFTVLEPQLDNEVEVIIVDDGCNEKELDKLKAKVIHLESNSGGAGKPRNVGIENAKGKYIAFIDADDMVTADYISEIKKKIKEDKDIIYLSWVSNKHDVVVTDKPPMWNPTVWSKVYKRELIGDTRFEEVINYAEDKKFNDRIKPKTSSYIDKQIYVYNNSREGSLSKVGVKKTFRVIFTLVGIHYMSIAIFLIIGIAIFGMRVIFVIPSIILLLLGAGLIVIGNTVFKPRG
ncbi:MAG: glycosyltransferase family 2 protein [Bacilli bacterium]|nr:glycosyltransferase family 2 protein [Bacilli bacterium]